LKFIIAMLKIQITFKNFVTIAGQMLHEVIGRTYFTSRIYHIICYGMLRKFSCNNNNFLRNSTYHVSFAEGKMFIYIRIYNRVYNHVLIS